MKRIFCKITAVISTIAILICGSAFMPSAAESNNDTVIQFGSYPKSPVTDEKTLVALNADQTEWKSYGYYEKSQISDIMLYKDVYYHGNRYRGVDIVKYRPYSFSLESSEDHSKQYENGYTEGNTYWFLYEPVKWVVLDSTQGLIISEDIIDSQPYNDIKNYSQGSYYGVEGYYANKYQMSTIRHFLNEEFMSVAFTEEQRAQIIKGKYEAAAHNYIYSSPDLEDYIVIPSYTEVLNNDYGFAISSRYFDTKKQITGTEYAKCQGLYVYPDGAHTGNSHWLLRTAGYNSDEVCYVLGDGSVRTDRDVVSVYIGIRPMMRVNLDCPFIDVDLNSWYTSSLLWCYDKRIMNGTSGDTFSPDAPMTRAMFVTILANLSGENIEEVEPSEVFSDVDKNAWYAKSVEWARLNGITSGTEEHLFSPELAITREQLAAMLYSYATYKCCNTDSDDTIYEFTDYDSISDWAYNSVKWALSREILSGNEIKQIMPKDTATRSQSAVMIKKFYFNYN